MDLDVEADDALSLNDADSTACSNGIDPKPALVLVHGFPK